MKYQIYIVFSLVVFALSSCYYDNKEDLYDYVVIPGEEGLCETANMSYANDIAPIINLQCNLACHNAKDKQGNIVLESYNNVKIYLDNGGLLGSINRQSGYAAMPPSSKVAQCDIDKIQSWVDAGAPNN